MKLRFFLLLLAMLVVAGSYAEEPSLPSGIGADEPSLPTGMTADEPTLPPGMSGANSDEAVTPWQQSEPGIVEQLGVNGFWEVRAGLRTRDPVDQRRAVLAETRLELEKDFHWQDWSSKLTLDMLYDDIVESQHVDLETGDGWLDLREAWMHRRLGEKAEFKLGRQVLTWGVGDLLFINDLFPKDWNSFLSGRDEQYLKAPSDALRAGFYTDVVNINVVYTPRFDSDRFIDGSRLSYYSASAGGVVGRDAVVTGDKPDHSIDDGEVAVRIYRQLASFEVAIYGYDGFWKSPAGFDPLSGMATFPALRVYGASVRGPLGIGIVSSEIGYYDSRDDHSGDNIFINNSEWRGLLGYEWEVAADTTLGLQYYVEALQDYGAYKENLLPGQLARDEHRQLLTARLTRLAMNQTLTVSLFAFYSPTDRDTYLRPKVSYKATDNWLIEGGLNIFSGEDQHSFFGQFESNSNTYAALRYSF